MPRASSGSTSRAIQAVISESRPNRVMNHGAPAATTVRSGKSGSKMRRAPRSSALRATTARRPSWSVSTTGTLRRHWAMRSAGLARATGWPHSQRGSISSPSMAQENCWHSGHSPFGGMMTSQRARWASSNGGLGERDAQAAGVRPVPVAEDQAAALVTRFVAQPRPTTPGLLDREQVGEVGAVGRARSRSTPARRRSCGRSGPRACPDRRSGAARP